MIQNEIIRQIEQNRKLRKSPRPTWKLIYGSNSFTTVGKLDLLKNGPRADFYSSGKNISK